MPAFLERHGGTISQFSMQAMEAGMGTNRMRWRHRTMRDSIPGQPPAFVQMLQCNNVLLYARSRGFEELCQPDEAHNTSHAAARPPPLRPHRFQAAGPVHGPVVEPAAAPALPPAQADDDD
eukprot:m.108780 g.108780  ORF g.108780 m.108780 type:complete len:121 (+) comp14290_c0_seq4:118-480(+)